MGTPLKTAENLAKRSLPCVRSLGGVRLDREFFISTGGPQVHEHSVEGTSVEDSFVVVERKWGRTA
jgi:hypothetical protein